MPCCADRKDEGFPAGGHALPSFSVLPVRNLLGRWGATQEQNVGAAEPPSR